MREKTEQLCLTVPSAVLEALLKREHYSVDVVHDGQDALDYGLAGNVTLDCSTFELKCGSSCIRLGNREFQMLELLMRQEGRLISTEQFMGHIWGCDSETAQASVDAFRPLAEADGKLLTAEIDNDLTLKGVPDNFFRLFSILLDNAVKYCDPGGTIRLEVSQRGRNLYLAVSDPCQGLDPAQLPRYFDRFYRADFSRARSTGGYGIGLSTAKAIVTRHRGRISNHYADGIITFTAVIPQVS